MSDNLHDLVLNETEKSKCYCERDRRKDRDTEMQNEFCLKEIGR